MKDYSLSDYEWKDNNLKSPRRGGVDLGRWEFNEFNNANNFVFNEEVTQSLTEQGISQQTLGVIYRKLKELNKE